MDMEAKRVGLKINLDKINVIRINAKNQAPISIVGKNIKEVKEFTYLGAKMEDLQNRLSKARGTYVRLIKIWNSKEHLKENEDEIVQDPRLACLDVWM